MTPPPAAPGEPEARPADPPAALPGRAERAVVWILCSLLPEGFRARQRGEWTGDLIALSSGSASARWRYLFAAAWTLPALRAHASKPGVDRPHVTVPAATVPAATLTRVIVVGLGAPLLAWLIAVPFRYVLLDIPARLTPGPKANPLPFDPKDLWPWDLIQFVPLWIALELGAWSVILGWMLLFWIGLVAAALGPAQRGAGRRHRVVMILLGVAIVALAIVTGDIGQMLGLTQLAYFRVDEGFTAAVLGALAMIAGILVPGMTRRGRAAVMLVGLGAVAIFVWHQTPTGEAMFRWLLD